MPSLGSRGGWYSSCREPIARLPIDHRLIAVFRQRLWDAGCVDTDPLQKAKTEVGYEVGLDKIAECQKKPVNTWRLLTAPSLLMRFSMASVSNIGESLNAAILPERDMLSTQAFHGLLKRAAQLFISRKHEAARETGAFPKALYERLSYFRTKS